MIRKRVPAIVAQSTIESFKHSPPPGDWTPMPYARTGNRSPSGTRGRSPFTVEVVNGGPLRADSKFFPGQLVTVGR
jgi:hypothetical protein